MTAASIAPHLDNSAPPAFLAYGATDGLVVSSTPGASPSPGATHTATTRPNPPGPPASSFQRTVSGHNMDSTQSNVDDMHTWIDHVVVTPAR